MKVSVIGLGKVGSSLAFVLSQKDFIQELILVGRSKEAAYGDVLDLRHGQLFGKNYTHIYAGELEDCEGSDVIAFCASAPSPPVMHSRLQLAQPNVALLQQLLPVLANKCPHAKIVMVSNPVDILVYFALSITGFAPNQIMGTGTLVDSARFRQLLADDINIDMKDIRAYILGEHGDSQFPAMSSADAGGEPLDPSPKRYAMSQQAAKAGFDVFQRKGYTNYAIALAAADIIECIGCDRKSTMPISLLPDGFMGIDDVCLSLPAVVGKNGVERVLHPKLNQEETEALHRSANILRDTIRSIHVNKK